MTNEEYRDKLWYWGGFYRYPPCCVAQFVEDALADRPPALTRGVTFKAPSGNGVYVPCDACVQEAKERSE